MTGIKRDKNRSTEQGATIIVVTICLAALVAMAAIAIDVASLYVARGEAERAANAAALAGASIFARSGITSFSGMDQTAICQSAQQAAIAVAAQNSIAGQSATITSNCAFDTADLPENPRITVKVQPVTLPTFFAKIWGGAATTVTATSTAEAYNQSGTSTPPVLLTSIKPWLLPNCDPAGTTPCSPGYFVNSDGTLTKNNFVGQTIQLNSVPGDVGQTGGNGAGALTFYPLNFASINPSPTLLCPSAGIVPSCTQVNPANNLYLDNVACSTQIPSQVALQCGQQIGFRQPIRVQTGGTIDSDTVTGASCLIHQGNDGTGQDIISASLGAPITIAEGENNPDTNLNGFTNISRSDSIVTVPLYNGNQLCTVIRGRTTCNTTTQVTGFLQLGIVQVNTSGTPQLNAVVLNAIGCNSSAAPNPANGITSNSAIPVRLVRNP